MAFAVEVIRTKDLQCAIDGGVVDQDPSQDGHLRLQALGGKFARFVCHTHTFVI